MGEPLPPLGVEEFPSFFDALWRPEGATLPVEPFEWQMDLVRQLALTRDWPGLVDLPTGSGKTSLLEIAVFLLALDAANPPEERWMPRRICLVVDRRVIVDQAEARGRRVMEALRRRDGIAARVSARLRALSGGGPPLVRAVLRGGSAHDETWAQRPDVPALLSSTVDQVGSRLLFRGYGISNGMRPVHAGLLGEDTLFLLDEVHLARPFAETLTAVGRYRRLGPPTTQIPDRWKVVQLSATPVAETAGATRFPVLPLTTSSHPTLARRLAARKPARLHTVKVPSSGEAVARGNEALAAACAVRAHELLAGGARTLGIIVNRVDTARRVVAALEAKADCPTVVLLTGRMRPFERDEQLRTIRDRLAVGRIRRADDAALVVVATQSVEAGADFDFDAIVTECASLDALKQRFGRVDRDGQLSATGGTVESVILIRSTDISPKLPDPVYGDALPRTWKWLESLPAIDFGSTRLAPLPADRLADFQPPARRAPVLLPGHLDQWAQTSVDPPATDPDPARWLHGLEVDESVADVNVVWRADLDESLFDHDLSPDLLEEVWDRLDLCPPVSGEALPIPISAMRRWLASSAEPDDLSDAIGEVSPPVTGDRLGAAGERLVLRWTGSASPPIGPTAVRPGDTIVVPSTRGGISHGNWDPSSLQPVRDIACEAVASQTGQAVVRLTSNLLGNAALEIDADELEELSPRVRRERLQDEIHRLATDGGERGHPAELLDHVADAPATPRYLVDGWQHGNPRRSYVVVGRRPWRPPSAVATEVAIEDEGTDRLSFTGATEVLLRDHLRGVGAWAREFAANLGLPEDVVADLELAGRLHDAGKVDPRFQAWLRGTEAVATYGLDPLAKSLGVATDRTGWRAARARSGYPAGARHELLSLAMLGDRDVDPAADRDLVRYLVLSHHGHGRYRFTPVADPAALRVSLEFESGVLEATTAHGLERLDRGVPSLFWGLLRRYGWYQLAWLESILRLADHHRSRREQDGRGRLPETLGAQLVAAGEEVR